MSARRPPSCTSTRAIVSVSTIGSSSGWPRSGGGSRQAFGPPLATKRSRPVLLPSPVPAMFLPEVLRLRAPSPRQMAAAAVLATAVGAAQSSPGCHRGGADHLEPQWFRWCWHHAIPSQYALQAQTWIRKALNRLNSVRIRPCGYAPSVHVPNVDTTRSGTSREREKVLYNSKGTKKNIRMALLLEGQSPITRSTAGLFCLYPVFHKSPLTD